MGGVWKRGVEVVWLIIIIIIIEGCCEGEGCLEQERSALLQLKPFFNPPPYELRGWVDDDYSADCCRWKSVECSNTTSTGRVTGLYLSGIPRESTEKWYLNASLFTPFPQLQSLYLMGNNIAGFIENKGLSELSNLKYLYLNYNYFNNSILSSFGALSSLRTLRLSNNRLKGSIEVKELDSLSNLEELDMSYNEIDNLVVPKDYKGLRKVRSLDLSSVKIRDARKLLQSLGSFPSLNILNLGYNNFTGRETTTYELRNFTNLEELELEESTLQISLLQSIAAFTSLKRLSMTGCILNGVLHGQGFLNFNNLELLVMDGARVAVNTSFLQIISESMASLKHLSLSYSSLNNNTILYQGLCRLVHLQELYIDSCNLRGNLPWCLANLTSLRVLDVSDNQLVGNISSSPLRHLTSIQELSLSNNQFQIPISLEPFFNLSKLIIFNGGSNELYAETQSYSLAPKFQLNTIRLSGYGNNGTLPKFLYHQSELQEVDISHINLMGEFPNWLLENNTELTRVILQNNSLSGPLHMPIHPHKQLQILDVSNNNFQGNIPIDVGAYLPRLEYLSFSKNAFNSSIPSSFGDMEFLTNLDLSDNQLTGSIPEHLAMGCLSLQFLVLSNNSLQGHIFPKKNNLKNLWRLQLDDNLFIGEIPESLSNCSFLGGLYLSNNSISGKIPTWLGNLSFLEDIIIPNNRLEGPIPTEFCQLHFLQILDLSENNISGSLTSCFGLSSIQQIHLSKNMIQGKLKEGTFSNSSSLVTLDLSYNRLNGKIPSWIERLNQLRYLILANNNLEGEVPNQLCQLKQLRLIDLSYNNLSGQIPPCLDNTSLHEGYYDALAPTSVHSPLSTYPFVEYSMVNGEIIVFKTKKMSYSYQGKPLNSMYGIDLSCNKLTGEIPPQISELTRIHTLNLSHNNLTGFIPARFSNLKQIESLDLSYNLLNGRIPPQLIELNALEVFSVAYNNLSGKIPDRVAQFSTFEKDSYEGNPFLCGLPLSKSCNENGSSPAIIPEASTGNGEDNSLIDMDSFHITFTVSYVIVILGIIGVLWVNPYWRRRWFYLVETWMTSCYYFVLDNFIPIRFYR